MSAFYDSNANQFNFLRFFNYLLLRSLCFTRSQVPFYQDFCNSEQHFEYLDDEPENLEQSSQQNCKHQQKPYYFHGVVHTMGGNCIQIAACDHFFEHPQSYIRSLDDNPKKEVESIKYLLIQGFGKLICVFAVPINPKQEKERSNRKESSWVVEQDQRGDHQYGNKLENVVELSDDRPFMVSNEFILEFHILHFDFGSFFFLILTLLPVDCSCSFFLLYPFVDVHSDGNEKVHRHHNQTGPSIDDLQSVVYFLLRLHGVQIQQIRCRRHYHECFHTYYVAQKHLQQSCSGRQDSFQKANPFQEKDKTDFDSHEGHDHKGFEVIFQEVGGNSERPEPSKTIFSLFDSVTFSEVVKIRLALHRGNILLGPLSQAVQAEEQKGKPFLEILRECRDSRQIEDIIHETQVPEIDDVDEKVRSDARLHQQVHSLRGVDHHFGNIVHLPDDVVLVVRQLGDRYWNSIVIENKFRNHDTYIGVLVDCDGDILQAKVLKFLQIIIEKQFAKAVLSKSENWALYISSFSQRIKA